MPKVNLGNQELDDNYRYYLRHMMVDTPKVKLCKLLGISSTCLYNHRKRPELLTVRELRIYRSTGRMTDEQILSIIRKENKEKNEKEMYCA